MPKAWGIFVATVGLAAAACCDQATVDDFAMNLTASQVPLTVDVDSFTCTGPDLGLGGNNPCNGGSEVFALTPTANGFVAQGMRGLIVGWNYDLTVDGATARLCAVPFTDTVEDCVAAPVCAATGTVQFDGDPATQVRLAIDVQFPNGLAVTARLRWDSTRGPQP